MTSYPYNETFGLYLAVLKKSDPSPLLPESDEDKGVGSAPLRRPNPDAADSVDQTADRAPRTPVSVQIDFDRLQQRIIAVGSIPLRDYSHLKAGAAGTVYYLETTAASAEDTPPPDATAPPGPRGSTLHRYRLSDRRAVTFMTNV